MCMPISNQRNLRTSLRLEAHKKIQGHMHLGSSRLLDPHLQQRKKTGLHRIEFSAPRPQSNVKYSK